MGGDGAVGTELAGRIGNGDTDRFGVDIQADIFDDVRSGRRVHNGNEVAGFTE